MITGRTKLLGVLGAPIEHSLSPVLQNAVLRTAGLDYVYVALPVKKDALRSAVPGLRDAGFCGFNVTIPFKTEIIALLDALDEDARRIGAVNTVVVGADGCLTGYNTDAAGFLAGFTACGVSLRGAHAVVLGAGGAARAVLCGLLRAGVAQVSVGVRNLVKGEKLCADFASDGDVRAFRFDDAAFRARLGSADVLVQTTPLGMSPHMEETPPVDWAAVFLREAARHGHRCVNGETMLAAQGAEAFFLWTGVRPDLACMRHALREALDRRA